MFFKICKTDIFHTVILYTCSSKYLKLLYSILPFYIFISSKYVKQLYSILSFYIHVHQNILNCYIPYCRFINIFIKICKTAIFHTLVLYTFSSKDVKLPYSILSSYIILSKIVKLLYSILSFYINFHQNM